MAPAAERLQGGECSHTAAVSKKPEVVKALKSHQSHTLSLRSHTSQSFVCSLVDVFLRTAWWSGSVSANLQVKQQADEKLCFARQVCERSLLLSLGGEVSFIYW